ncbi:MAG: D-sedoheptulose 7-phosphate isomerase [Candidatus Omnitrophica bacterium]|nr:D-sedoheptulose 7-phosphate isomerase [Candidatus Omnitrophota bacterium]
MKNKVEQIFRESIDVKEKTLKANLNNIVLASKEIVRALKKGKKIIFFGNGGSAADSQHAAAELVGRFQKERRALPAIALTTDTSILTALGNDYSFDIVFKRQIEALGQKGDVAFGISTSGNSQNVVEAIKQAKKMGLKTMSLSGRDGGALAKLTDISIIVPAEKTARIQESHSCIIHAICELVESQF